MNVPAFLVQALLLFAAVGSGLLCGVFFAFSTFVLGALGRIPSPSGIAAMRAINATIVRSLFLPLFLAITIASLALSGLAAIRWGQPGSAALLAAGSCHVLGVFACTLLFNLPLNRALERIQPEGAGSAEVWSRYLRAWAPWNHVRTLSALFACALYVYAIVGRQG